MDQGNEQHRSMALPLPVVPRLDRLDHLVKLLEDNHKLLKRQESDNAKGEIGYDTGDERVNIKPVSTALEEVHFKGTLMDRIALLEQRVLQLSLQMDMDNRLGSSSTRLPHVVHHTAVATSDHGSSKESFRMQQELEQPQVIQDAKRPEQTSVVKMEGCGYRRWRRKTPAKNRKKLFEWLQI